jgi:hypothetical protein
VGLTLTIKKFYASSMILQIIHGKRGGTFIFSNQNPLYVESVEEGIHIINPHFLPMQDRSNTLLHELNDHSDEVTSLFSQYSF